MMVWLNSHAGLWGKPLTPGLRGPASESGIMIIACLSPFLFFSPLLFLGRFLLLLPSKKDRYIWGIQIWDSFHLWDTA